MDLVYDASFITALIIPDEKDEKLVKVQKAIDEDDDIIYTSQIMWYEIANTFMNMIRRKRYVYEHFSHFFKVFKAFDFKTDFESGFDYSEKLFNLCNEYKLTAYDAAYLELAKRKSAVLCTLDEDLIAAAKKHGVEVIAMSN
jgi:predicted nucleic acid-binding protein